MSTSSRGYGTAHQAERARWQPVIDSGLGTCRAERCRYPDRAILPGADWHLGHTPDRRGYIGPCHPLCNVTEGGSRGGQAKAAKRRRPPEPHPGLLR
jgi:hypothetical protein